MGGLAAIAKQAGYRVTGCDEGVYPPMSAQLQAMGIELIEGWGLAKPLPRQCWLRYLISPE